MFENQQRDDVEALMKADAEFRRLYLHHKELDSKVHDAEIGVLPIDLAGQKEPNAIGSRSVREPVGVRPALARGSAHRTAPSSSSRVTVSGALSDE